MNISKEEYINKALEKPNIAENISILTEKLKKGETVIFTKFGDGEFNAMRLNDINSHNCDGDQYTFELGIETVKALCELSDRSTNETIFIGKWHTNEVIRYYHELYYNYLIDNNKEEKYIPYVDYHFIFPDHLFDITNSILFEFVKTIQESPLHKIIVSNVKNSKLQIVFNTNNFVQIPERSWYANGLYNNLKTCIEEILKINNNAIVLIAAGLASKILINELSKEYPKTSFIDLGSGYDIIARKYPTRAWGEGLEGFPNCYKNQLEYFKPLLPPNYDDL